MPIVPGMDRRAIAGLVVGLAGLCSGVTAILADAPALGLAAGVSALAGALLCLLHLGTLQRRDTELRSIRSAVTGLQDEVERLRGAASAGHEAIEVAGTFAEMVAVRNLELSRRAGQGDLLDELTGLFDIRFFQAELDGLVAAARRHLRPVTLVLLQIDGVAGEGVRPAALAAFGGILRRTLREADTACRVAESRFALILEDTPEDGGVWAAERIRGVVAKEGGLVDMPAAGVASYPSHALDADELLLRAEGALTQARSSGEAQVQVAPVD